jgi:hypothetical protein
MVELAPLDTGELESSGVRTTGASPRGRRQTVEFEFRADHAAVVHELPQHARGPGTRSKPGNEFGPAGPKYIERVLRGFKIGEQMADALRQFWRSQRSIG